MKLVDSTFLIDLFKAKPSTLSRKKEEDILVTSQINMYELLVGVFHERNADKILKAREFFENMRVLPVTEAGILRSAQIAAELMRGGLMVDDALKQLQFSSKHAAQPVKKLLDSAIANAIHNYQAKRDSLIVKNAFVDGGSILYRWLPLAMGRATPIRKRTAHITIVLSGEAEEAKLRNEKKATEKRKDL